MERENRSSSAVKDAANWSRYYSGADLQQSNKATNSSGQRGSLSTSMPSTPVIIQSTDSVGSQTLPWSPDPSDTDINLVAATGRRDSRPSMARTWSWRVNRHNTRISPPDEDNSTPTGWDEPGVRVDTADDILQQATYPKPREATFSNKKKKKQKKRRESHGANLRGKMGFCNLIMHDFRVWWARCKRERWEIPVFRTAINTTESHFGSSVVSLFIFTKWIFCLNLGLAMVWFTFVILPNMIFFPYTDITNNFRLTNLFDGKGVLGESWMFYGHYPSMINSYHLDLAYLSAILVTYFGSFFIILRGIAKAQRNSEKEDQTTIHRYTSLVLTSWDYSITSREAVNQSSLGIINTFKDLMVESKAHAADFMRSHSQRIKVKALRALAWIITIILIGGGCAGIIMLVVYINFADQGHSGSGNNTTITTFQSDGFIQVYGTTLIFSLVNMLVPMVIIRLPLMEKYSTGKKELTVTLARVFCLRMANLIALLFSLYDTIQHVVDDQLVQSTSATVYGCVGTVIGQELYKLVIMDTILHAIVNLSMYFCRYFWTMTKLELHLPSAILVIIYRQALIWVGTLACPMMPFVGLMSNSVFFGVNYLIVHRTCKPPEKRWNQSRHSAFFLRFLLFSLLILLPAVSYVVGSNDLALGKASGNVPNGPFGLNQPTTAFSRFRDSLPLWMKDTIDYILSDVVLLPAFLLLITIVLYQRLLVGYTIKQTVYLKADLIQEREDNKNMAKRMRFLQHMELTNRARTPGRLSG